jgi:hypothetical protein
MVRVYAVLIAQSMSTLAARRPGRIAARMPASAAGYHEQDQLAAGGPDRPQPPQLTDPLEDRQPSVFTMPSRAMMIAKPSREWRPGTRRAGPSLTATKPAAAGQRACGLSEVSDEKPLRVK